MDISAQDGCEYNGMMYKTGESFMDSDGCNTCFCSNGAIACTLKFCLPTSGIGKKLYRSVEKFNSCTLLDTCTRFSKKNIMSLLRQT